MEDFKLAINSSRKIVGFTGAGISTESGIPDYRSKGGIWDKFKPVLFDEFITDEKKRVLYWQRKQELWKDIKNALPNSGHLFFKNLYDKKKLAGLVTQNIDGLHEKSGLPRDIIVNLHGNNLEIVCLTCSTIVPSEKILDNLNLEKGAPLCERCGGLLKPNTISFGQNLREQDLERANTLSLSCDLMIVVGSTLVVSPASSFPTIAKENGAILAIISLSETPADGYADFVIRQKMGDISNLITC
ncbi:MAG: sigma factor regulator FecR [Planctomycetes bacterium]|nr:sigma factor regulator FecR [Planctomycetota bacterium]